MTTNEQLLKIATATRVVHGILNARLILIVALLMTFGLFCWAMTQPTWLHFAIAGLFGVTIFLPVLWGMRAQS